MKRKRIKIFRGGPQVTAAGQQIDFSESDLDGVVKSYDPATHEAPIVFGHPKDGAQAHGWVKAVAREGDLLFADADFADEAVEAVKAGGYRKVSASFYAPTDQRNPKPGSYHLRHVGLLGAQIPAVKGLGSVEFGEGDDGVTIEFDFAEADPAPALAPIPAPEPAPAPADPPKPETSPDLNEVMAKFAAREAALADREAKLAAAEAAQKRAEAVSFAEGLAKDGRLLPRDQGGVVELLLAMPEAPIEFAEGGAQRSVGPAEWLREFLGRLPKQIEFRELAGSAAGIDLSNPQALAEAAQKLQADEAGRGIHISAAAAVRRITGGAAQ